MLTADSKVAVTLYRKAGGIWYSNNWTGTKTEAQVLCGGWGKVKAGILDDEDSELNSAVITASSLVVYPNPSSGPATFRIYVDESAMTTIDILSSTGQVVQRAWEGYVRGGEEQTVSYDGHLAKGLYFVQMRSGNQVRTTRLIISNTF
jgi:trimeric autotransporter adhesin